MDQRDVEALAQFKDSRGYRLFAQRVQLMLLKECAALEEPQSEIETAERRGSIRTIRALLQIPDILLSEARESAKQIAEAEE